MDWLHMHRKRPQAMGWGRPNLVHNGKEKMYDIIFLNGMIKQAKN
jgi:hypothetical protein